MISEFFEAAQLLAGKGPPVRFGWWNLVADSGTSGSQSAAAERDSNALKHGLNMKTAIEERRQFSRSCPHSRERKPMYRDGKPICCGTRRRWRNFSLAYEVAENA
jgi:hypothetical protein